jgi:UPF0176 protein|tara:strand:- start:169 stop:1077 length:909 start_codon:yes stop_codon:yes gene_type:complete
MFNIFGFYKFTNLTKLKIYKQKLQLFMVKNQVRGTLILAKEGINGTISGKKVSTTLVEKKILKLFNLKDFDNKNNSSCNFQPFHKAKIKIKKEVVPIGLNLDKKNKKNNNYVEPKKWNELIKKKDTLLIDARKPFEYKVGTFKGASNPNVNKFRDFPKYLNKVKKNQSVAMFCTGGIRCEKASVYLKNNGFKNVYQLKGGILAYLEKIKKEKSLWKGECYVFDNRISLKHKLKKGTYSMCSGCRTPVSVSDKKSKKYEAGVSCLNCYDRLTSDQKERFRMRQKQISLAKQQGKSHIFKKEFK